MSKFDVRFEFNCDEVIRVTPMDWDRDGNLLVVRREKVMDKETFIECYERWIKESED